MIHKEPRSPWWLVCANLVDSESLAAEYWGQWVSSIDIVDVTGQELVLATHLYGKWPNSSAMDFDPRIIGNARRTFYRGAQSFKAIEEIDSALLEKGIAHAWLRESGMRFGNFEPGQSLPVHHLEMLISAQAEWKARDVLNKLGWTEHESKQNAMAFKNSDHLEILMFSNINPHWTPEMHRDLQACISQEGSGISLLLDLLSQIQLERVSVDWLRIYESMLLLNHLMTIGKWETLVKGAKDYLVLEPLMKVYQHFVEVLPKYAQSKVQVPVVELQLNTTYAAYMKSGALRDKARYHIARYRAINSVSTDQLSPLNYVLATRSNRKVRRS